MMIIIIILSLVISYGGGGNSVEMTGIGDSALVEESSGLHLLEINKSGWRWLLRSLGFNLS